MSATATTQARPWESLAEARHGDWSDFAAWEAWMQRRAAELCGGELADDFQEGWDGLSGFARVALYVVMCDAVDAAGEGRGT